MGKIGAAIAALAIGFGAAQPASAQDYNGNFMVRVLAAGVVSQDSVKSLTTSTGTNLKAAGFDAEVSDRVIPAATLSYFLSRNLALELFCCFTKHHVDLTGPVAALNGKVADACLFPPAVTLQYHFDGMGAFKPYVGVGVQYIHFFNEKTGNNPLRASSVSIDDAFGFTLQAGLDVAIGNGWYLNADVKKTWLETTATWTNPAAAGVSAINAKVDLDPLIVSGGLGYRFNLGDLFGRRSTAAPLK